MSSRREVLIRMLALLPRKTLTPTKNRALKCLKWLYLTVRSRKNVAVLTEDGAFSLFFHPHPRAFDSSRVPTPGNLPSKAKKNANARGSAWGGGWAQVELTDALLKLYSNVNSGRSESDPCPFAQTRLLVTPQTIQHS